MNTITKRMISALAGAAMMMSSVCLPQFTASAAIKPENEKPVLYGQCTDTFDWTLLKTCEGVLEESEEGLSVSLTGDDLDGKSYDTIYADIRLRQPLANHDTTANIMKVRIERTGTETNSESGNYPMNIGIDPSSHEESTAEIKVMQNMKEDCSVNVKADFYHSEKCDPESDGDTWVSVLSGEYSVCFYGYNFLANHMPDDSELTELGTVTYDLESDAEQKLVISGRLLDQKYYSGYLAMVEYEPLPDADPAAVQTPNYMGFDFVSNFAEYSDYEASEGNRIPMVDFSQTMSGCQVDMQEKENGKMVAAALLPPEKMFGADGCLECTCIPLYCPYGSYTYENTTVETGILKVTVYGYDPYNLPLLKDMDFLGKTGPSVQNRFYTCFNLSAQIPDAYYLFFNGSEAKEYEKRQQCAFAKISFSVNRTLHNNMNQEREFRGLYQKTETIPLYYESGAYQLDLWDYTLLPDDEIEIRIEFLRADGTDSPVDEGQFMLYDYFNPEANHLPPAETLVLLGETETELSAHEVSDFVEVSSELLYKAPFTEYFAVAEYDGNATEMYFGVEKVRVVRMLLGPDDDSNYAEEETFDSDEYCCEIQDHQAFVSIGRPEVGYGRLRVSVAPQSGTVQATSGTLKIRVYGYNPFMLPDYADMNELKMLGTDYRKQDCTVKIDDAYDLLVLQTRHVDYVADHADITIRVIRDDEVKRIHTGTLPLYNGTMLLWTSTFGADIEVGDEVSFTIDYGEEMNAMMDEACAMNGAELHIYGRKRAGTQFMPGDVSCDGIIDVSDAVMLARFVAEDAEVVISDQGKQNADVNRSGSPDQEDIVLILKRIARLISEF